jgi:hypothetical protein
VKKPRTREERLQAELATVWANYRRIAAANRRWAEIVDQLRKELDMAVDRSDILFAPTKLPEGSYIRAHTSEGQWQFEARTVAEPIPHDGKWWVELDRGMDGKSVATRQECPFMVRLDNIRAWDMDQPLTLTS